VALIEQMVAGPWPASDAERDALFIHLWMTAGEGI
jgi:hypothetical protein